MPSLLDLHWSLLTFVSWRWFLLPIWFHRAYPRQNRWHWLGSFASTHNLRLFWCQIGPDDLTSVQIHFLGFQIQLGAKMWWFSHRRFRQWCPGSSPWCTFCLLRPWCRPCLPRLAPFARFKSSWPSFRWPWFRPSPSGSFIGADCTRAGNTMSPRSRIPSYTSCSWVQQGKRPLWTRAYLHIPLNTILKKERVLLLNIYIHT